MTALRTGQAKSSKRMLADIPSFSSSAKSGRRAGILAQKSGQEQEGFDALWASDYAFIGNLDADLSFQPDYFQKLLDHFNGLNSLGIAGGWICESDGHEFIAREFNVAESVPHAVHLLRRECYQQIGDYLPPKYGGEDTCAVVTARMRVGRRARFATCLYSITGGRRLRVECLRVDFRREWWIIRSAITPVTQ